MDVATGAAAPSSFSVIGCDEGRDLALLEPVDEDLRLAEDLVVIPRAYRRGAPPSGGRALLQLSITEADLPSSVEVELRPSPASAGHVEFVVPAAREGVKHGYSGAAVVELAAGSSRPRLLGIVRARDRESIDVLDHAGAGWLVPMERIAERFTQVAALVETPVERSPEWTAHWQPRSRGVAASSEPGHFFSGRQAACAAVGQHLQRDAGLAVVTGSRGCGKSAVLAHVLVSSCPRYRTLLEATDPGASARLAADGLEAAVDAALLARAGAAELAAELARQLGVDPCGPRELIDLLGRERPGCRIVIDAVDESPDPDALMRELVVPLSQYATVAIGALARHVVRQAPSPTTWIDLDDARYGDDAIPAYVAQRLRERGSYDEPTASRVAAAVAERARGNFLVGELVSRRLATRDPIDTTQAGWHEQLPADLTDAFRDYITGFGSQSEQQRVLALLAPLAYAHGEGLTLPAPGVPSVWLETANKLKPDTLEAFADRDLREASERAGDYLIVGQEGHPRRLYHEGTCEASRAATQTLPTKPSRKRSQSCCPLAVTPAPRPTTRSTRTCWPTSRPTSRSRGGQQSCSSAPDCCWPATPSRCDRRWSAARSPFLAPRNPLASPSCTASHDDTPAAASARVRSARRYVAKASVSARTPSARRCLRPGWLTSCSAARISRQFSSRSKMHTPAGSGRSR